MRWKFPPGRETRLPLRIRGEGEGPRLRFSFDQLDIGKVFVGSAHSYEVSGGSPPEICSLQRSCECLVLPTVLLLVLRCLHKLQSISVNEAEELAINSASGLLQKKNHRKKAEQPKGGSK